VHVIAPKWLALVATLIVAWGVVGARAACAATPRVTTGLNGWIDTLIDTQVRMSAYLMRMASMRDAIEVGGATARACNPANALEHYERITKDLARLVTEAPDLDLDTPTVTALGHIKDNWELLERRRRSHWAKASGVQDLDPVDHCFRPSSFGDVQMDMDRDFATVLKAAVRKMAQE
jgi:hypothetical protein